MKKSIKKLVVITLKLITSALLLLIVCVICFSAIRGYRNAKIRELVYTEKSPNNLSTLKIYQIGGESAVFITTQIEIECSSDLGTLIISTDVKNGHMIKINQEKQLQVEWNETENGGEIDFKKGIVPFSCQPE